jgi:NADPH2 dehydrogenase
MQQSKNLRLDRWSPLPFKNGLVARNRVVIPPMASKTADGHGIPTENSFHHYQNLNRAGAGIIFVEYTLVHSTGRSDPNQMGLDSDSQILAHRNLVSIIKASGALAGIQLVHAGGKSAKEFTGGPLLGASAIVVPTVEKQLECPLELNIKEIETYQSWYVDAAVRAAKAGYDIVELHCAHGYGLNQWLSPLTNQRRDDYGGSLKNRSKMLLEIFQKIRTALPDKILGVRLPGQDHLEGGLLPADMIFIAQQLQQEGADFLDVSSGIGGWRRPRDRVGEGYLLAEAAFIQYKVQIPVIGVGGIESGDFIDRSVGSGEVALTAVGRKILNNPQQFYDEVLARIK